MLVRPTGMINGGERPFAAGYRPLAGRRRVTDSTNGNITLPVAGFLAGWIDRSGPGAGYADTTPTADQLLAALPELMRGDSFDLLVTSSVAFANTIAAGTGITLAGTTSVAASSTREYLLTLLSEPKRTRVCVASTTNANAVLTNMSQDDMKNLGVGMLATGTGIGASAAVLAINLTAGTVTLSVNSTATADNIAVTFTPNFEMRGIRTAGN
jgi:hypothetical protein